MSYTKKETEEICVLYTVHVHVCLHLSSELSYLEDYFNA